MIHLLASGIFGTVQVVVPLRTFVSAITIARCATNFDIHTGTAILPASGTQGVAIQSDRRSDEAGDKKRAGSYKESPHFVAENLRPGLARKRQ